MSTRVRTNSHKNQISTCSLLDVKLIKLGITKNEGPFMTAVLRVNLFNLQMRGIKKYKTKFRLGEFGSFCGVWLLKQYLIL